MAKKRVFLQTVDEVMALREAGAYIWWYYYPGGDVESWNYSCHGPSGHASYEEALESAEGWLTHFEYGLFVEVDDEQDADQPEV